MIGRAKIFSVVVPTLVLGCGDAGPDLDRSVPAIAGEPDRSMEGAGPGLLYGRVITDDEGVFEGRLRWGGGEEALWGNYFNGFKDENSWAVYVPRDELPTERRSVSVFGLEISWERRSDLGRPFMVRFGDITRIEPRGREIRVTLKSGTAVDLDRFSADDVADGLRVWDTERGIVDLGEWGLRTIELMAGPTGADARALHGTVRTPQGDFTGLIQWDREAALVSDTLRGLTPDGEVRITFDAIASIARRPDEGSMVILTDGRELALTGTRQVGAGNRGVYVDDPRYGRVLVSWEAFEGIDFSRVDAVPGYDDFPASRSLRGSVRTRSGHRFEGRLVYDLDESDTAETLDAPWQGVDYTIPFALIEAIVPRGGARGGHAVVSLRSGEVLELERAGDLGERNAGLLVFVDGRTGAEYVPWRDVERIVLR